MKPRKQNKIKKIVIYTLVGTILIGAGLATLDASNRIDLPFFRDKPTVSSGSTVNYGPPTKEEKDAANAQKEELSKDNEPQTEPTTLPSGKKSLTPVIASYGQNPSSKDIEVSGFVPGTVERGGTCTLTIIKDGQTVSSAASSATPDASTVSCGLMAIDRDKVPTAGAWSITISYASSVYEGTSQPLTLEVQ